VWQETKDWTHSRLTCKRGDFQFYIESQATDLLQLAGTLVVNLRLDKSPDTLGGARLSFLPDAIRKVKGLRREGHTLDDKRAMLGFAYLDSVYVFLPSYISVSKSSLYTKFTLMLMMHEEQRDNIIPKNKKFCIHTLPNALL
jgi:hypothetical protein